MTVMSALCSIIKMGVMCAPVEKPSVEIAPMADSADILLADETDSA